MKHLVGFSGGITSSVATELVLREHPDLILLYHDTKTEPQDNDRFRQEVAQYLNTVITEDSDGRDIWELFDQHGYLGNGRNTMCSSILKQQRSLAFLQAHFPVTLYIGFTSDEWRRAQRLYSRYTKYGIDVKFPLIDAKLSKEECFQKVTQCWKIDPPTMYGWSNHANCIPCIKGKKAYWGTLYQFERAAWEKTVQYEEKFGHTIFTTGESLKELLPDCLRLAKKYLEKKDGARRQESLFEFPCECAV